MEKYYTMQECFEACDDDDFMIHEETGRFGNFKIKKKDIINFSFTWLEINSDKWQIKRAETKVLTAEEIIKNSCICETFPVLKIVQNADKNGQLREWLRPEQVELRKAVNGFLSNRHSLSISRLIKASENLQPPTAENK